jgi:Zn-dependent protease/predicted transcriptional regulator
MSAQQEAAIKGSWKVGKFAGISVYIHPTFLILIAWIMFVYWSGSHSIRAVALGVMFTLALFACVVLHEFGHALTARHYGIRTEDITLLPIGGVSRLERIPDQPRQEFYVALMGPIVSATIALLLFLALWLAGASFSMDSISLSTWTAASFLMRLMIANATLAIFNLVPALPMDGGRIFRALLSRHLGQEKATRIAAGVGHGIAVLFAFLGLFTNPFLFLIALFIWIGASQEATMVQMKTALKGVSAGQIMVTDFVSLSPEGTLERVVKLVIHGTQQDFPVVANGRLVGMLGNKELLQGLSQWGVESLVTQSMRQHCPLILVDDELPGMLEKLQNANCRVLPVVDRGELVGLFTAETLAEFVMVWSALNRYPTSSQNKTRPPSMTTVTSVISGRQSQ